jgi:hypothetical protein
MIGDQLLDEDVALGKSIFKVLNKGLVDSLIDRGNAKLPDTFVPSAKYIAVANDNLLLLVHPTALDEAREMTFLDGHEFENTESIEIPSAKGFRLCISQYGKLWAIERQRSFDDIHEVLVFNYDITPVLHRKPHGAIALAENCHPNPRKEAECLCWIPITT